MYVYDFKTKLSGKDLVLEIAASEKYIESIKITGGGRPKSNRKMPPVLTDKILYNELNLLPHLYKLINLLDKYFSAKNVEFNDIPINFSLYSDFSSEILIKTQTIKYNEILSYKQLAIKAGYDAKYSRACAAVLSVNKTPIVVPCHRVIYTNGKLGGWSGGGWKDFKSALLLLEKNKIFTKISLYSEKKTNIQLNFNKYIMNKISTLFLDIGNILLTNGWDTASRKLASKTFDLDYEEFAERHGYLSSLYEEGRITLNDYLDKAIFYDERSFSKADFQKFYVQQVQVYS
jgi:O-6-methylguanine DNA methyltransferase